MKRLTILCLLLAGCSTTVRDKNGVTRFRTFSDITNFDYQDETTKIHADILNNSLPTRAGGSVIGTTLSGAAAAGLFGVK